MTEYNQRDRIEKLAAERPAMSDTQKPTIEELETILGDHAVGPVRIETDGSVFVGKSRHELETENDDLKANLATAQKWADARVLEQMNAQDALQQELATAIDAADKATRGMYSTAQLEQAADKAKAMSLGFENTELKAQLAAAKKRHVATLLLSDPEDERDGFWLSIPDQKRLTDLPAGTKLYIDKTPG